MSDLSDSELRRLDLTLLLVFLGLVRHRKAAVVARDLGLTQSAISQALRRLREVFGDDLFLRRPHGMEPTATALALEAPVADAVEALRGALGRTGFDPVAATGTVRIAALHAEQAVLIPNLFARLRRAAPGLTLSIIPSGRAEAIEALKEGGPTSLWASSGTFQRSVRATSSTKRLRRRRAARCVDRGTRPQPRRFCAADHVLTSPAAGAAASSTSIWPTSAAKDGPAQPGLLPALQPSQPPAPW